MATTRAASAAASGTASAPPAPPAPATRRAGRGGRRVAPPTAAPALAAPAPVPAAATAAPATAPVRPSLPSDAAAAALVLVGHDINDLPIWRTIGALNTAEPEVDSGVVVVGGKRLLDMSFSDISVECGSLVCTFAPTPGQPTYGEAWAAGMAIEQDDGRADGAAAFRRSLARGGVTRCLVTLALGAGLLKEGGGYVYLPSVFEVARASPAPPAPLPTPTAQTNAAMQEEVSKAVALQFAAMATKDSSGGGAGAAAGAPGSAAGGTATTDPDAEGLRALTKKHDNTKVWDPIDHIVRILRNEKRTYDFRHLKLAMEDLIQLTNTIGTPDLDGLRKTLENALRRGNDLVLDGYDEVYILRLFSELLPARRAGANATRAADRARLVQMWKARGGRLATSLAGPFAGASASSAAHSAAAGAAQPYSSSAPLPVQAPLSAPVASLSLPLPGSTASSKAPKRGGRAAKGSASRGGGGARPAGTPPATPSAQATQELHDYNVAMQARQEAFLPSPAGATCPDCQTAGRNAHHLPNQCAYVKCAKCKRGGHRARRCRFPAYP